DTGWPAVKKAAISAYEGTRDALSNAAQWTKDTGWPAVKKAGIATAAVAGAVIAAPFIAVGVAAKWTKDTGWP
ncbi:rtx repeat protein, partial [Legionella sainthelensi]